MGAYSVYQFGEFESGDVGYGPSTLAGEKERIMPEQKNLKLTLSVRTKGICRSEN